MISAIVYTTNIGSAGQYAGLMSKETGLPAYSSKDAARVLPHGAEIIYIGWIMAGCVKGYSAAAKRYAVSAVCGVGIGKTGTGTDNVREKTHIPGTVQLFTLRGNFNVEKLRGIYRLTMKLMVKTAGKELSAKADRTPEEDDTEELFRYSVILGTVDELGAESVCINDILEQSLAGFYGTLSERGIVPDIVMPERAVVRTLDRNALRRVFDNILSNAAKYSDGDLTVRLSPDGAVMFENGAAGLDTVQTAHLFDRFFTVDTARGGTGPGLSIAMLLTEKMGGSVTAEYCRGRLRLRVLFPEK